MVTERLRGRRVSSNALALGGHLSAVLSLGRNERSGLKGHYGCPAGKETRVPALSSMGMTSAGWKGGLG